MNLFIGAVCLALIVVAETATIKAERNSSPEDIPVLDYHRQIGIPEAIRIQKYERNKIAGGLVTDVRETPYQAGIVIQILPFFTSVCGATLISSTRLVTAAHCKDDGMFTAQLFTVVLGSNTLFTGGIRIITNDIVLHPNWQPSTISNDIAVIRIDAVTFTQSILPINLPEGNELWYDFVGWTAVASGYGLTSSDSTIGNNQPIRSVILSVISNQECRATFGSFVQSTNLCTSGAGGKGTCGGDSGGPLVVHSNRSFLIGVVSFGSSAGCTLGYPSAYTRVTSYVRWIQSQ